MFFMMPVIPAEQPPAIVARAPEKIYTFCHDATSSMGDRDSGSSYSDFFPVPEVLMKKLGLYDINSYKVSVLTQPLHGKLRRLDVAPPAISHWTFIPDFDYEGADTATFQVEAKGRLFKIVVNFWVVQGVGNDYDFRHPLCKAHKFSSATESQGSFSSRSLIEQIQHG